MVITSQSIGSHLCGQDWLLSFRIGGPEWCALRIGRIVHGTPQVRYRLWNKMSCHRTARDLGPLCLPGIALNATLIGLVIPDALVKVTRINMHRLDISSITVPTWSEGLVPRHRRHASCPAPRHIRLNCMHPTCHGVGVVIVTTNKHTWSGMTGWHAGLVTRVARLVHPQIIGPH